MRALLSAVLLVVFASSANASIAFPGTYSQNFDSLASTGTDVQWVDNVTLPGWYSTRTDYRTGAGTDNTGDLYSFGSAGSSDRALGSIASNATGSIPYALELLNTSGQTITQVTISYTGEQWRTGGTSSGGLSLAQTLRADLPPPNATPAIWFGPFAFPTPLPQLFFTSPIFGTAAPSALDGNAPANRVSLTTTITTIVDPNVGFTNLNWAPGTTLWLRFGDENNADNDHGLAIDDLQISAPVVAVPEPTSLAMFAFGALGLGGAALRRRKRVA